MKIRFGKICILEGLTFPGYASVNERGAVYACFNNCSYGHLLLKDIIEPNSGKDDLDRFIKFYLSISRGKFSLSRIESEYTETRGGFVQTNILEDEKEIISRINRHIDIMNQYVEVNPRVETSRPIIWLNGELVDDITVDNIDQYFNGHEFSLDELAD